MRIAAIVPAYNEARTIGEVVKTLVKSRHCAEILVVSDGSTDATVAVARAAGARVIDLKKNGGKGAAVLAGLAETDAEILFLADADLLGFTLQHVDALLTPVVSGEAAMTVGLRDRGRAVLWLERFLPLIGGERVLRREILATIEPSLLQGFGLEVAMNAHCRTHAWSVARVPLHGLGIRKKVHKVGVMRAIPAYARMLRDILRASRRVARAERSHRLFRSGTL